MFSILFFSFNNSINSLVFVDCFNITLFSSSYPLISSGNVCAIFDFISFNFFCSSVVNEVFLAKISYSFPSSCRYLIISLLEDVFSLTCEINSSLDCFNSSFLCIQCEIPSTTFVMANDKPIVNVACNATAPNFNPNSFNLEISA